MYMLYTENFDIVLNKLMYIDHVLYNNFIAKFPATK